MSQTVVVTNLIEPDKLTDQQLADRLVAQHGHRNVQTLYGQYVIARGLSPRMDAKPFAALLANAVPNLHEETQTIDFVATHFDTLLGVPVMLAPSPYGFYNWYAHGSSGHTPGPIPDRYVPLDAKDA